MQMETKLSNRKHLFFFSFSFSFFNLLRVWLICCCLLVFRTWLGPEGVWYLYSVTLIFVRTEITKGLDQE